VQLPGILRTWNAERGFGFIAPTHGGAEIFVHVSAFPRDGSQPAEGESLLYELGRGQNGRPQAVRVVRRAIGEVPPRSTRAPPQHRHESGLRSAVIALLVVAGAVAGYAKYIKQRSPQPAAFASEGSPTTAGGSFRCDGRTYCSQMTSCAEATYFLKNCPGVKMDGNNDGVPCEQQWCR